MKKVALVTVIGLPGSGKSTLCGHLCKLKMDECFVMWIEYDKLIPSEIFSQNPDNNYWKDWRQAVLSCTERLLASWRSTDFVQVLSEEEKVIWLNLSEYSTLNAEKIIVLLDDNFYYSSMRRVFYSLAKNYASVVFKCDVDICIRRNCTRMNPVDEHTIHKMAEKFEWPDPVNNLWEKYTILVNSSNEDDVDDANNPLSLLNTLKSVLDSPIINDDFAKEEEKNRDRSINLESLLHNADNHLRKVANHIIKSKDPSWRTLYAKSVSKVKLETLRMLHDVLYKEDSVWSIEDCQNLAENLFHEQLSKVFSEELLPDIK